MPRKSSDSINTDTLLRDCLKINKMDSNEITDLIAKINTCLQSEKSINDPSKIILLYLGLADAETRIGKFTSAEEHYGQSLKMSSQAADITNKIRSTNGICVIKAIHNDYLKAIEGWQTILADIQDIRQKSDIYNNLGIAYSMSDRHREALECQYNCLKIDEELNRETQIAIDHFNLASSYMKLKQYSKSLELYNEAIVIFERNNDLRYLSYAYSNVSMVYSDIKEYEKALEYANRSLEIKQKYANELEIANTLVIIGSLYKINNDKNMALDYYNQSLAIFEKGDDPQSLAGLYLKYAHFYYDDNNQRVAKDYCLKAFNISETNAFLQVKIEASKLLSRIYADADDYQAAYRFKSTFIETYMKMFEDNPKILIAKSESEYYRIKTEEQAEFYRLSNIELTEKNRIISEQSEMLNITNHKLQKTNSMLKKLLSVIGHDIRGPVSTTAQAMRMIRDKEFNEDEIENIIEESAVSMQNTYHLLNELLSWSNSSQNESALVVEPVDICSTIPEDISIYRNMANLKNITINFTPRNKCFVMADVNYLHSIIRNLIHNAIKFTPNKGQITISTRKSGSKVYVSIIDNGLGMTANEVKKLKDGKAKVKQGTHFEMGSGFGIGLCLDYLAQMNSNLIVKSSLHQGSKFTIVLNKPV